MLSRSIKSLLLMFVLLAHANAQDEFLDPEQAFRFSARLTSDDMFEVRYLIEDGYYMYRERFRFEAGPGPVSLGAPVLPAGVWHEDEFFGRSEIYRGEVTIRVPVLSGTSGSGTIRLTAISQGCADAGICYLPTTQTMDFERFGSLGRPVQAQ
jgi:thioredoxin:protein disulfide reductase